MGVGVIAAYQAGYKVAEMLNLFSRQLQDALSPAAAHMNASGDSAGLRELLLKTSKLTFLITTPLYGLCAVYLEPLIQLLTGLESVEHDTVLVGQILLFAVFSSQLTNSCAKRILMMCGYEKKLLGLSLMDGLANLGISITLAFSFGIVGVAIGTLIPTLLVGWLLVLPMALRYLDLGAMDYTKFILSSAAPLLLFAPCLMATVYFLPMPAEGGFIPLAIRGGLSAAPAFIWIMLKVRKLM
jgi:O-antigen/teichoic acid export membrane protein